MTSVSPSRMQGLEVREAINQGLSRAALAATKDSEAERIYANGGKLPASLGDLCGSATENYMAAISCLLKAIPSLNEKDSKSGKLVRSEVDRMLVRLEKVKRIQEEISRQDTDTNSSGQPLPYATVVSIDPALHEELVEEGIVEADGSDRRTSVRGIRDLPVGCKVNVDVDGVLVKGKISGKDSPSTYVVSLVDQRWLDHVEESRISLCLESNHDFQTDTHSLRQKVVEEIVETERAYVKSLETLMNTYYKPMQCPAAWGGLKKTSMFTTKILTTEQSRIVFGNLEELYGMHKMFLSHLEGKMQNWDPSTSTLGDVLVKFSPFFKSVTGYSNNFQEATKLVITLTKECPPFRAIQDHAVTTNTEALTSLMIKPIQRIPRYKLLLKELLKRTPPSHPDFVQVTKALTVISEVAKHINETLKKHENQVAAYAIGENFDPPLELAAPHREFKFKNQLTKFSSGVFKHMYTFWLFTDILVYGRPSLLKPGRFRLQRVVHITHASGIPFEGGGPNSFVVHAKEKALHLVAPNPTVKQKWLTAIGSAKRSPEVRAVSDPGTRQTPSPENSLRPHSVGHPPASGIGTIAEAAGHRVQSMNAQVMSTLVSKKEGGPFAKPVTGQESGHHTAVEGNALEVRDGEGENPKQSSEEEKETCDPERHRSQGQASSTSDILDSRMQNLQVTSAEDSSPFTDSGATAEVVGKESSIDLECIFPTEDDNSNLPVAEAFAFGTDTELSAPHDPESSGDAVEFVPATAQYDFTAMEGSEELSFSQGDSLQVQVNRSTGTVESEDGWVVFVNAAGQSGLGPLSYVQLDSMQV